jgi:hypothetical protein
MPNAKTPWILGRTPVRSSRWSKEKVTVSQFSSKQAAGTTLKRDMLTVS